MASRCYKRRPSGAWLIILLLLWRSKETFKEIIRRFGNNHRRRRTTTRSSSSDDYTTRTEPASARIQRRQKMTYRRIRFTTNWLWISSIGGKPGNTNISIYDGIYVPFCRVIYKEADSWYCMLDPRMKDRLKAIKAAMLAMRNKQDQAPKASQQPIKLSGEPCRKWNSVGFTYPRCRHSHVCISCGENHPATRCTMRAPHAGQGQAYLPTGKQFLSSSKPYQMP